MADMEREWLEPLCDRLARGQVAVLDWLEAQSCDLDDELADDLADGLDDDAVQALLRVGELARARAGESQVMAAVRHAREAGWQWAPIALLIGMTSRAAARWFTNLEAQSTVREGREPDADEPAAGTVRGPVASSSARLHSDGFAGPESTSESPRAGSVRRP